MTKLKNILKKIKRFLSVLNRSNNNMIKHDGIEHAGYMAFLMIIAIFPFLILLISLAGFLGQLDAGRELVGDIIEVLPEQFLPAIMPRIDEIISGPPQSILTIAILGMIWTASSILQAMRNSLNHAYHVASPPNYLIRRLGSLLQFLVLIVILLSLMFFLVIFPQIIGLVNEYINLTDSENITVLSDYIKKKQAISQIIFFLLIMLSYYTLPNEKHSLKKALPGTIFVFIFVDLLTSLLTAYVTSFNQLNYVYGSIASFIIALIYFYCISLIYIFGAEFNYEFKKAYGKKKVR